MNFRVIKDSIIENVLTPVAVDGKFIVIGYQRQSKNATETLDLKRTVQVFYFSGEFPKSAGRLNGPTMHDITFRIELTVSSAAKGDLSVLNNPSSTAPQRAAALAAFQEAADLVDDSFDEFAELLYQIFMSGVNYDLGLDKGIIANRWIDRIEKDQPEPLGGYVTLTGALNLTCRTVEEVPGAELTPAEIISNIIKHDGDDETKTGVDVEVEQP